MTRIEQARQKLQEREQDLKQAEKVYHDLGGRTAFMDFERAKKLVQKAKLEIANLTV